jgi:hypothetical protein
MTAGPYSAKIFLAFFIIFPPPSVNSGGCAENVTICRAGNYRNIPKIQQIPSSLRYRDQAAVGHIRIGLAVIQNRSGANRLGKQLPGL